MSKALAGRLYLLAILQTLRTFKVYEIQDEGNMNTTNILFNCVCDLVSVVVFLQLSIFNCVCYLCCIFYRFRSLIVFVIRVLMLYFSRCRLDWSLFPTRWMLYFRMLSGDWRENMIRIWSSKLWFCSHVPGMVSLCWY